MKQQYKIGDVYKQLGRMANNTADIICLDDAWARPHRGDAFGVKYPTHDFEMTKELIDECHRLLTPGGWLIADCDDWLLPRLVDYLRKEWGDAAEDYKEGFRKTGRVTLTSSTGEPDRSTPGMYLSTGGYPVVFAHKGETSRKTSESASQIARRPTERYGWGSVKPIEPYKTWLNGLAHPGEKVLVPCAGTAPGAIAAEMLNMEFIAIDCEAGAKEAYQKRRDDVLQTKTNQTTL